MPAHVKDFLVEINLIRIGFLPHPAARTNRAARSGAVLLPIGAPVHGCGHANLLRFERRLVGLQHNLGVLVLVSGVDHEVVVVASGHDVLRVAREDNLEFIEDTVVFVRVAETRPEMFVDRNGLHGLPLHVDIPDLNRQIISGNDVSTVIREADIGDRGNDFGEE